MDGQEEREPGGHDDHVGVQIPHGRRMPLPNLTPPLPLKMSGDLADNWRMWKQAWQNFVIVSQLDDYPMNYQAAALLHSVGTDALKVYNAMKFLPEEHRDVTTIMAKFDSYTIGETNETYERYILNNRVQADGESFEEYLTAIRTLSKSCNFCECLRESLLRDKIVTGIRDPNTRKRLLQETKLSLKSCIAICRSAEATNVRIKAMNSEDVHRVSRHSAGSLVHPDGVTRLLIQNPKNKKAYSVEFVIVSDDTNHLVPLLGSKAVQQMGLLTVNVDNFVSVCSVSQPGPTLVKERNSEAIIKTYSENFEGELGTLPGKVHLQVNPEITPSVSHQNRVPISQREELRQELNRLMKLGVLVPVDEPTDWVSSLVIAPKKSGGIRICIDPKRLNEALRREHYQLPTIEEVLPDLTNAKVFSTCDLSAGFWHLELDLESSLLCTFGTPFGRYRWTRLPFGLSVSPEIFQKRLIQALEGLPGVKCIVDDILIYGSGYDKMTAQVDHDKNLECLMQRCQKLGIKLKKEKLKLCRKEVTFLGHIITDQGLKCDPQKIKAVLEMPAPQNVEDIQRFSGFVNYLARYLPRLSGVMQPLRQLTHTDVDWTWMEAHEKAFTEVKKLVTKAPVLAYYNEAEELTLQCDASSTGLGAVLLQQDKPIAYASRALTPAESRYAQIEKEMLSVVFGLQKFHTYTFGRKVTVENDHKPLEAITSKPLNCAPRRLQSMILAMQQYDATIKYKKGADVVLADTLSRAYLPSTEPKIVEPFSQVNMAKFLPITMKTRIHTSHLGIEGCLRRARESLYWPHMSDDIKQYISTCELCCKYQADQQKETLQTTEVPERPWQKVASDLFTLNDKDYLITVDYYSNFWEVDCLSDTKSTTVIKKLKAHFPRYGIPDQLVSDNGPQFYSEEFNKFVIDWDIEHLTSSPHNSQANGKAESAVKTAKKLLRKAKDSGNDQYMAILDYRNTPTQGLGSSPVQRLMNRRSKTLLPTSETLLKPRTVNGERERLCLKQQKQKSAFDKSAKDLTPLEEGDTVRMKPFTMNDKVWKKGTVLKRLDERSYEVDTPTGILRRNRVHLRKTAEQHSLNQPPVKVESEQRFRKPLMSREKLMPSNSPTSSRSNEMTSPVTPPVTPMKTDRPTTIMKQAQTTPPTTTRSGRSVKLPKHLRDFTV